MDPNRISKVMTYAAVQELLAKCHPLGMFDAIATLAVASNMRELYRLVLVGLPRSTLTTLRALTPATTPCLQRLPANICECVPIPFLLSARGKVHQADFWTLLSSHPLWHAG
jgi:hypothetical protein